MLQEWQEPLRLLDTAFPRAWGTHPSLKTT
jgi:hypothetical protein